MSVSDRLGSLSNVKPDEPVTSPKQEDGTDGGVPLIQRTAIIQKDEKGYGLTVSGDNPVYVASVKPEGAAAKAGVQQGDKIIKVNGKLVTNSNHTEVVKMIKSGSYVALTLLGKPTSGHSNRDSTASDTPSFRDSFADKITAPLPVDAEKDQELKQSKVNTIRQMYNTALEEYEKLRQSHKGSQSEKMQAQIAEKEKTVKLLHTQLRQLTDSQSLDTDSLQSIPGVQQHQKHMKHSSMPAGMYRPSQDVPGPSRSNVARSKSDVSSRKYPLAEYSASSGPGYRRTESSPEVRTQETKPSRKISKSESFKSHFRRHAFRRKSNPWRRDSSLKKSKKSKLKIRKTASMPTAVSDIGSMSDSPHTSPSTSPTPQHPQNMEPDSMPHDSGIDDGSQSSVNTVPMRNKSPLQIIGIDDDDFNSEDETTEYDHRMKPMSPFLAKLQHLETGDSKVFADLKTLETKPAHMSIFLHYVLTHHNPAAVLFYHLAGIYSTAQGNLKDLKKWAYEIHSTFIVLQAPLKVNVEESIIQEIDRTLQYRGEKEEMLRTVFHVARHSAQDEVNKLLEDLRQKKEQGLIEGSNELKENMEKAEELKIVEKYLVPDLEKSTSQSDNNEDEKFVAQSWAIATFLRHIGLPKQSQHSAMLERTQSFVSKDKRGFKSIGKAKSKTHKGHNFVQQHFYKTEYCMLCTKVLWGVGFQGYQCQTCEQCIHKNCIDDLEETCSKKRRNRVTSGLFKKPLQTTATPIYGPVSETDKEPVNSPTVPTTPSVFTQAMKDPEDKELTAFQDQGHSVTNLVSRFNNLDNVSPGTSPERETAQVKQNRRPSSPFTHNALYPPPRKGTDLGRSESMKGRVDQRDQRPARRSKSDVDMDENTIRALNASGSSSTSSLSNRSVESPSSSMDTLTQQIQDDSDFDVEPDLPSLKQVLGEDTVRKLKPKEKKRQDVINELFYTEKCHVRNLKILDKLFYRPMLKDHSIPQEFTKSIFPNLETMIALHSSLNSKMKTRRKEKSVISSVGDILLLRFDEEGENFRNGCAIFCRNQSHALESLKARVRKDPKMAQLLADAENNPLCQRLALKDIIPKQIMRLTKYPLLIENLLKYTQTNTEEYTNLERALQCSKHILEYVNQAVKDCENHQRLIDLQRRIDKKLDNSAEMEEIRTFDLIKYKLIHDGALTWQINNKKSIELHVVLLERAMVLLQKQEDRLVLKSQSTNLVPGKEDNKRQSPLMWLSNVLTRPDATDRRAFFVVNTSKSGPQIYKLVASTSDEQKRWTKFITQAADAQKKSEISSKKKTPVQEIPVEQAKITEVKDQITRPSGEEGLAGDGEVQNIPDFGDADIGLVHPEDVKYSDPIIATSVSALSPLEQLQQNDEKLETVLEERQGLIAELMKVTPSELPDKVENLDDDARPEDLIAACQQQTTLMIDMVKDGTLSAVTAQQHAAESGEGFDDIEGLTLPIPMDRLRDMACRMNQILTNLLAQTRASSSMTTQAAVNAGEEERNKLRNELKLAQQELNHLRKIQQAAEPLMDASQGQTQVQGRPSSLVSDASTISESGDEQRDDDIHTEPDTTDTNDETIPETPRSPEDITPVEALTEISQETLTEVSPVTVETYPDEQEVEIEVDIEEDLHEMDPPEEEEIEDMEPPAIHLENPIEEDEGSSVYPIDGMLEGEVTGGIEICEVTELESAIVETVTELEQKDTVSIEEGSSDQSKDYHHSNGVDIHHDSSDQGNSSEDSKRSSGEVFHDAPEALDHSNKNVDQSEGDLEEDVRGGEGDQESKGPTSQNGDIDPSERTCDGKESETDHVIWTDQESVLPGESQTDCVTASDCDSYTGPTEAESQSSESTDNIVINPPNLDLNQETDETVTSLGNTMTSEEV